MSYNGQQVLKVLLVRHAQSANNIVQAQVQTKLKGGSTVDMAQSEWLANRQDDPDLSADGYDQLQYLRKFSESLPAKIGCKTFKIYTSPMQRACSTAKSMVDGLGCVAECKLELTEVGGVYHAQQDPNGNWVRCDNPKYYMVYIFCTDMGTFIDIHK